MRVLLVGSGGREHALAEALARSPRLTRLWVAPGNPGTRAIAEATGGGNVCVSADDIPGLVALARDKAADLVVPGAEAALVAGLADALASAGLRCFGPGAQAARLEGSKSFTKAVADAAGIPTARWERFDDKDAALAFVRRRGAPIVVKADGLAAGKGVVVADSLAEAEQAIEAMMGRRSLGEAGTAVVIEECLSGDEVSLFALCDGTQALLLGAAQDHKRLGDGDSGPNTGGMGAVSPPAGFGLQAQEDALELFVRPALAELSRCGTPFRGVLFAGLMLTDGGPRLIEYNVRLGDPEAQCLLPRLRSDLLDVLDAACDGRLGSARLDWEEVAALVVVAAARGYPGTPATGGRIGGLAAMAEVPGVRVFQAGTAERDGTLVAAGGRVLGVCATAPSLGKAREAAYAALARLDWPDGIWRRDIGLRALLSGSRPDAHDEADQPS